MRLRRPEADEIAVDEDRREQDSTRHEIEVTAFPLLGKDDDYFGVVAIFWELRQG